VIGPRAIAVLLACCLAGAALAQQAVFPPPMLKPVQGQSQQSHPATTGGASGAVQGSGQPAPPEENPGTEPQSVQGQGVLGAFDSSGSGGPVEIDASEGIEWQRDQKVYIARGNARVARGDMSVSADTLTAHYRDTPDGKTAIYMVEADGHVVIVSKDARIEGDRAIYDLDKGSAIITGGALKATSKANSVTARDALEYWTKQGAVVARGDAVAKDKDREVQADLLTGYFRIDDQGQKKLYQVEAIGNVRLLSNGNVARAAKAIYNLDTNVASLNGGVKITRGKNQLNGEHAVYNVKTGQARITGGGSQVKTLLVPGSDNSAGGVLKP